MTDWIPCPFCGSRRLTTKRLWDHYRFVACLRCKAAGPIGLTNEDAVARWNARNEPDEAGPTQERLF